MRKEYLDRWLTTLGIDTSTTAILADKESSIWIALIFSCKANQGCDPRRRKLLVGRYLCAIMSARHFRLQHLSTAIDKVISHRIYKYLASPQIWSNFICSRSETWIEGWSPFGYNNAPSSIIFNIETSQRRPILSTKPSTSLRSHEPVGNVVVMQELQAL